MELIIKSQSEKDMVFASKCGNDINCTDYGCIGYGGCWDEECRGDRDYNDD